METKVMDKVSCGYCGVISYLKADEETCPYCGYEDFLNELEFDITVKEISSGNYIEMEDN